MAQGDLEYLYHALSTPLGIVVKVSDIQTAKRRFYKARADSGDPDLEPLQFHTSPYSPDEIWIVRSKPQLPSKEANVKE